MKLIVITLLAGVTTFLRATPIDYEFFVFDASNGLAANGAQTIKCTRTGRMVITTIGHVNFFDGHNFTHIAPESDDIYPLPGYNGHYRLMFDRHHHLWLKDEHQVACVDLLTETINHEPAKVLREMGFDKPVDDLFADRDSKLWMLTGGELRSTDRNMELKVRDGVELQDVDVFDSTYVLLFYADGQVEVISQDSGKKLYNIVTPFGESEKYSRSSVVYSNGSDYFQIRNGDQEAQLRRLDVRAGKWTNLLSSPFHLNNMVEHRGVLYIAAALGYFTYDLASGELHHVETLRLSKGRTLRTDVNAIAFDLQGGLWLGTEYRGLLYGKPIISPFKSYTWSQHEATELFGLMAAKLDMTPKPYQRHVNSVFKDSRGWTWTALYSGLKVQKPNGVQRHFGRKDGLMNEMVHSVVEDNRHDIWASTSHGIAHLFVKKDSVIRIETYTNMDNVPSESFVNGMAAKLDDGRVVMQSLDHMVVFNPDSIYTVESGDFALNPKLIRLDVNGLSVEAGEVYDGMMILDRAVTRVKEIHLNYDQNTILMRFSGLNYFRPIQTYYRVRVKGSHRYNKWRMFSHSLTPEYVDKYGQLFLSLMNLKPGNYEVEVQTSMTPNVWKGEPFVWQIVIHQPWWRSTGVYILLLFVVLALMIGNFMLFNLNTKLRMNRNSEETDILRRIKTYAARCEAMENEMLAPYIVSQRRGEYGVISEEFVDAMLKIIPYVNNLKGQRFSVEELSERAGVPLAKLYGLLAAHLDKSPRALIGRLRLERGTELLRTTDMSIAEIAEKLHFVSPNYFIASFYHQYRVTPQDYRSSIAR